MIGKIRVIIAGSRRYEDYEKLKEVVGNIVNPLLLHGQVELVSGGATGADRLSERFAREYNYPIKVFPADWNKYGNSVGPIRNKEMAVYAKEADLGMLIAFPLGESRGTRNMIQTAKNMTMPVFVVE